MSENKQKEHVVPVWGIFLLFLGVVFLLQTLNVLQWGLWGTLWHYWPVLIIVAGISILLRRLNVWLVSLLILVILFGTLGLGIWRYGALPAGGNTVKSFSQPLDNLTRARVEIDYAAGSFTLGDLSSGSANLVEASLKSNNQNIALEADFNRQGSEGTLTLQKGTSNSPTPADTEDRLDVNLTGKIPLTLNVKIAAGTAQLDLSDIKVTELRLDVDVGNYIVTMPSAAGEVHANIKSDVSNLEITIPDGVAARILVDTGLSAADINQSRFPKQGNYYISNNYATSQNRIDLEISSDVGRVEIR